MPQQNKSKIKMVKEEGEGLRKRPKNADSDRPNQPFESAWEKWCNSKYGSLGKTPYDPSNTDEFPTLSQANVDQAPMKNLNCKSKNEILPHGNPYLECMGKYSKFHSQKQSLMVRISFQDNLGLPR